MQEQVQVVYSVKETKEVLVALNEVSLLIMDRMKDGVDFSDFIAFYEKITKDEEFQKVLRAAWEGKQEISKEVGDISILEGMELLQVQIGYLPKILERITKKE